MTVVCLSLLCIILILFIALGDRAPIVVNIKVEHCGMREIRRYALPDDNGSEVVYERGGDALELIAYREGRLASMSNVPGGSSLRIQSRQNIKLLCAATSDIVKIDKYA